MTNEQRIKQEMERQGLNARELAQKSGVSGAALSYGFSGRNGFSTDTITKIAVALNVPLWYLLGEKVPKVDIIRELRSRGQETLAKILEETYSDPEKFEQEKARRGEL